MKLIICAFSLFFFSQKIMAGCIPCSYVPCNNLGNCCGPRSNCQKSLKVITTSAGIPVNSEWKQKIYSYALENVVHPAWGIAHSERDYLVSMEIAKRSSIQIDEDVLFAASFLHDLGGMAAFEKKGVDHAVRSVQLIEPLLKQFGFPMEKWPDVREMVLGHTYYGPKPQSLQAKAFRDADVLDFIGIIGATRILSTAQEVVGTKATLSSPVGTLVEFAKNMDRNCILPVCFEMAKSRKLQLQSFLQILNQQSFGGKAL